MPKQITYVEYLRTTGKIKVIQPISVLQVDRFSEIDDLGLNIEDEVLTIEEDVVDRINLDLDKRTR